MKSLLSGIWLVLILVACASAPEKKILQEKDYEAWQRDLVDRLTREPENTGLLSELVEIALINEDFALALLSIKTLQEKKAQDPNQLAVQEISILRHAWRLDDCLKKIDEYVTAYPKTETAAALLKQKPIIEKSKTLPAPLATSPYPRREKAEYTFAQLMQAPEIGYFEKEEKESLNDLRKMTPLSDEFWARINSPAIKINSEADSDVLHFPSPQDAMKVSEPPLPQVKKERDKIWLVHSDFQEETLPVSGGSNCLLPAFSPWGDFFVASCRRKGGNDLILYVRANGAWQETEIQGGLNTDFDELSPRISSDGKYLFFASDGLPGYGGFDYYFSAISYEKACAAKECVAQPKFAAPVNFGPQVNTFHNEIFPLQISPYMKGMVFSAQGKKTGLVGKVSALPQGIRIADTLSYRFVAYSGTASPAYAVTVYPLKNDPRGPMVLSAGAKSDWIRLIVGAEYDIAFIAKPDQKLRFRLRVPTVKQNYQLNYIIERFSFETSTDAVKITYGEDASSVTQALRPEVERIAHRLKENPLLNIVIEGHTDNIGGQDYNQTLSDKRAEAIKKQLVAFGISPQRITTRGWGEARPLNANSTNEERTANRRVEILVVP